LFSKRVADPLEGWGEALIAKKQPDQALAKFEEAEKYAPNWGHLHLKWGKALGLQATMTYLGMSVGPGLGGFLTQHFGWPSVFFINVPISLVLFAVSSRVLSRDGRSAGIPFDRLGTASVAVALGTLS